MRWPMLLILSSWQLWSGQCEDVSSQKAAAISVTRQIDAQSPRHTASLLCYPVSQDSRCSIPSQITSFQTPLQCYSGSSDPKCHRPLSTQKTEKVKSFSPSQKVHTQTGSTICSFGSSGIRCSSLPLLNPKPPPTNFLLNPQAVFRSQPPLQSQCYTGSENPLCFKQPSTQLSPKSEPISHKPSLTLKTPTYSSPLPCNSVSKDFGCPKPSLTSKPPPPFPIRYHNELVDKYLRPSELISPPSLKQYRFGTHIQKRQNVMNTISFCSLESNNPLCMRPLSSDVTIPATYLLPPQETTKLKQISIFQSSPELYNSNISKQPIQSGPQFHLESTDQQYTRSPINPDPLPAQHYLFSTHIKCIGLPSNSSALPLRYYTGYKELRSFRSPLMFTDPPSANIKTHPPVRYYSESLNPRYPKPSIPFQKCNKKLADSKCSQTPPKNQPPIFASLRQDKTSLPSKCSPNSTDPICPRPSQPPQSPPFASLRPPFPFQCYPNPNDHMCLTQKTPLFCHPGSIDPRCPTALFTSKSPIRYLPPLPPSPPQCYPGSLDPSCPKTPTTTTSPLTPTTRKPFPATRPPATRPPTTKPPATRPPQPNTPPQCYRGSADARCPIPPPRPATTTLPPCYPGSLDPRCPVPTVVPKPPPPPLCNDESDNPECLQVLDFSNDVGCRPGTKDPRCPRGI